jgi:hypothetical protein
LKEAAHPRRQVHEPQRSKAEALGAVVIRYFVYALGFTWALPNTLLGACFVPLALLSGGAVRFERGAMEIHGGLAKWHLRRVARGASAMTLGHVILGQSRWCLDWARDHEHVHVRQYMRWGPFFLPAYALSSFLCWCRGQNPYFDNRFEKPAYEQFP